MKRQDDYVRFTGLMALLGEGCKPNEQPSDERIEIYFRALADMPIEKVEQNALECLRRNSWFPSIPEIRNELSKNEEIEAQAQKDYALIEHFCCEFLFPGFYQAGLVAIEEQLKSRKKENLLPMVRRWGGEIVNTTNPSAVRAQFLNAYRAELKLKISGAKQIQDQVSKLLDGIGK